MGNETKKTVPSVLANLVDHIGGEFGGLAGQEIQNLIADKTKVKQDFERMAEDVKNHIGGAFAGVVGQEIQDMIVNGTQATLQANGKTLAQMTKNTKEHLGGAIAGLAGQELQNSITGGTHVAEVCTAPTTPGNAIPKSHIVRKP